MTQTEIDERAMREEAEKLHKLVRPLASPSERSDAVEAIMDVMKITRDLGGSLQSRQVIASVIYFTEKLNEKMEDHIYKFSH